MVCNQYAAAGVQLEADSPFRCVQDVPGTTGDNEGRNWSGARSQQERGGVGGISVWIESDSRANVLRINRTYNYHGRTYEITVP
jgi:hypothetical protein